MTLELAQKKLEQLLNELNFWENRKEELMSIVLPKAMSIDFEKVDGGKREDNILKYAELEEKYQIEDRIKYLRREIIDLEEWINTELNILKKYGDATYEVVYLKELKFITDLNGNKRHLTWGEIADKIHFSERTVQRIYERYKKGDLRLK